MSRFDRREKLALDESYRYYRQLEKDTNHPELYRLARCLKTMNAALSMEPNGHFKLTRQLWKRVQQGPFDKLISSFAGYVLVCDDNGRQVEPKSPFPDAGDVEFHPQGCRRADDIFRMEIKHLYPGTQNCLAKAFSVKGAMLSPEDFASAHDCTGDTCFMKPVVFGQEVLAAESQSGRQLAYHDWWDLYLQAYCTSDRHEQALIYQRMDEIESVWGNLYY